MIGAFFDNQWTNSMCIDDPTGLDFYGAWGTQDGKVLNIDIDRCYEKDKNCRSDDEIEEFF